MVTELDFAGTHAISWLVLVFGGFPFPTFLEFVGYWTPLGSAEGCDCRPGPFSTWIGEC